MADFEAGLRKDFRPEEFERFRDWIHNHSGIYLEDTKVDSLRISLVSRSTRYGFQNYDEYFQLLLHDDAEFKELMNLVTINETSFFRFPAQFDALRSRVVPEILGGKSKGSSFRAWSAGCSTGEEPYSVAISLLEYGLGDLGHRPEVLGTDVSTQALERAKAGVYQSKALAGVPNGKIQRWFEPASGGLRPIEQVRDTVGFSYHNLVKEPYPASLLGSWDVIFCRNVTIYFRLESTRRVVESFFDSLNPGGYLFIGHSETLTSISDRFETIDADGVFLYRKPRRRRQGAYVGRSSKQQESHSKSNTRGDGGRAAETSVFKKSRVPAAPPPADVGSGTPERAAGAEVPGGPLVEAYAALEQGRREDALDLAAAVLSADSRNADALLIRAYAFADTGDFGAAVAEVNRALEVDPLMASAHYVLGIIYLRQGDQDRAMAEFKRTIYVDREFVLAHFNLAGIYRARGDDRQACREYENTLETLRTNPEGVWTTFLGGFMPGLLSQTCERSLVECRKGV